MAEPKRGRGRPPKLPAGKRVSLRCVVLEREAAEVMRAAESLGLSQAEFTRRAVLDLAARALKK